MPEDLSLLCFGEGKLIQRSKRQGYPVFFCAMPFSWFLFCHVKHCHLTTCTKACQTISGLVCKTRGRRIIPRHAIGWNLRVCLLWLTGVESSILLSASIWSSNINHFKYATITMCDLCVFIPMAIWPSRDKDRHFLLTCATILMLVVTWAVCPCVESETEQSPPACLHWNPTLAWHLPLESNTCPRSLTLATGV